MTAYYAGGRNHKKHKRHKNGLNRMRWTGMSFLFQRPTPSASATRLM